MSRSMMMMNRSTMACSCEILATAAALNAEKPCRKGVRPLEEVIAGLRKTCENDIAWSIEYNQQRLVKDIDMVAYGEPQIVNFGSGNKAGFTLVQLIETSNICALFVPDDGNGGNAMYLDVFSCKEYDDQIVINLVKEFFGAKYVRPNFLTRQA